METEKLTASIDERIIEYTSETVFLVQTGRYSGSYRSRFKIVGNINEAWWYYRAINIGRGFKKRILMEGSGSKRKVLARQFSACY